MDRSRNNSFRTSNLDLHESGYRCLCECPNQYHSSRQYAVHHDYMTCKQGFHDDEPIMKCHLQRVEEIENKVQIVINETHKEVKILERRTFENEDKLKYLEQDILRKYDELRLIQNELIKRFQKVTVKDEHTRQINRMQKDIDRVMDMALSKSIEMQKSVMPLLKNQTKIQKEILQKQKECGRRENDLRVLQVELDQKGKEIVSRIKEMEDKESRMKEIERRLNEREDDLLSQMREYESRINDVDGYKNKIQSEIQLKMSQLDQREQELNNLDRILEIREATVLSQENRINMEESHVHELCASFVNKEREFMEQRDANEAAIRNKENSLLAREKDLDQREKKLDQERKDLKEEKVDINEERNKLVEVILDLKKKQRELELLKPGFHTRGLKDAEMKRKCFLKSKESSIKYDLDLVESIEELPSIEVTLVTQKDEIPNSLEDQIMDDPDSIQVHCDIDLEDESSKIMERLLCFQKGSTFSKSADHMQPERLSYRRSSVPTLNLI